MCQDVHEILQHPFVASILLITLQGHQSTPERPLALASVLKSQALQGFDDT